MSERSQVIAGSGNVFADMGLPNPEERLEKARLAIRIQELVEERGWTQAEVASALGIDQPKVSNLLRGRLTGFSLERLLHFLQALGQEIEIVVREKRSTPSSGDERRAERVAAMTITFGK